MSKIDTVRSAMMQAMKDQNKPRKAALSMLLSALKAKAIDKRADLTEEEENTVVMHEIKQAQETLETAAGRADIEEECRLRITVYSEFAPKQMDEAEIHEAIESVLVELNLTAPTAKEKGAIMKRLMPLTKGKADGGLVNRLLTTYFKG